MWRSSGPDQPKHVVLFPCPTPFFLASRRETWVPMRPEMEVGIWARTYSLFSSVQPWVAATLPLARLPDLDVPASAAFPASGTDLSLPGPLPIPSSPTGSSLQRPASPVLKLLVRLLQPP